MVEIIAKILEPAALIINVFGLAILLVGFTRGAVGWLRTEFGRESWEIRAAAIGKLRCVVGLHILFALELMIVADIIDSFVAVIASEPGSEGFFSSATFYSLVQLGILVTIRTVLDFFLSKELKELRESAH